jgi:hypothetical protein
MRLSRKTWWALLLLPCTLLPTLGQEKTAPKEETWWSLKPLVKPAEPQVPEKFKGFVRNPVDRFVLARLLDKKMTPSPETDRRTLIRRIYFDLIGLPPTPEEIDAFANDPAGDAYEKVVDRLLASPRYGERWARHWMDVIHFAETHGHDQDVPRDNAWPYRDYLIDSFNADKSFGRFIEEQIAGDVLFPDDPRGIVALGFLAAGPWDESSLRDIREDSIDRKAGQYLDRDDMIGTVSYSFLSTTVQCARCHDHKFDPISQEEYYSLQAVFAGADRGDRSYDADPTTRAKRGRLAQLKADLSKANPAVIAKLLQDPANQAHVAEWEKSLPSTKDAWTVLDPSVFTSAGGATPVKQADLSIRYEGKKPEKDTYVIEAAVDLAKIAAVRLEVMADDTLPKHGPGRQDNGNLHLSEFKVEAVQGTNRQPVKIARAFADFNQDGWDIGRAIDGQIPTAWGIYPAVGQSHAAVFVFAQPMVVKGPTRLIFTLEQQHGGGHLIGRPRLSASGDIPLSSAVAMPASIKKIVAKTSAERTDADKTELAGFALRTKVEQELATLSVPKVVYSAAGNFAADGAPRAARACRPVHMLKRGDIKRPLAAATPGALACVSNLEATFKLKNPEDEGQRRAGLARWISDPKNPLTWRSIANRVWHYHFGQGVVTTPNDFGRMGATPTHPELLDWLAGYLLENNGSLKKLHRLLVTSGTYRQSSQSNAEFAKVDADNAYLWRMQRTKLDAETVRDSVLQAAGKLDLTMGGPSVKHFIQTPGIHRTPNVDYLKFDPDAPGAHRRSIYRLIFRTVPDPFFDSLDCPDASQFTPVRSSSLSPLQALTLLNDPFMVRMSEHFAKRVETAGAVEEQVRLAYRLALGREPTERERRLLGDFATRRGMAGACRVLLNSNEFMFVD